MELEKPDELCQVDNNEKESEAKSSEANSSNSSDVAIKDKLHLIDSNKTEYTGSKPVEDKDDNVKEHLNDDLMDLDKAKHVGCSLRKSTDGESIEYGSGEGPSSESEKSPKKQKTNHALEKQHELNYCETFSSEETTQENDVQVNQTIGPRQVNQLNPEGSSLQLSMGQCSPLVAHAHNQGVSRPYSDPLQNEPEKLCELRNYIFKFHEAVKLKLKLDHEKELAEVIAEMNRKYEAKFQEAEAAIQSKRVKIETSFIKVAKNKLLADAFRSKGEYMTPFDLAVLGVQSGEMQFQGQPSVGHSASSSRPQVSRILQQPPLQMVHRSAYLVPGTPTRPRSNPSSIPVRPPQSTSIPFTTPTRPPLINHITPSTRPPSTSGPMTPFIKLSINSITPANREPPNIKSITPSCRPPPSNNPNSTFARNPRAIRAPAPHIHPFTPQISSQSPAASVTLPSLYTWHPLGSLPAMSSLLPETSVPPMPSISVSNTGLYSASGGSLNLCLSLASQPEFSRVDEFGKEGSSGQRDPESPGKYPKQQPPPPSAMKDEEAGLDNEDYNEHDETLCGSYGKKYVSGEFWIYCDFCERWFHGECVKITPARAEHIKQYKCPTCSNLELRI